MPTLANLFMDTLLVKENLDRIIESDGEYRIDDEFKEEIIKRNEEISNNSDRFFKGGYSFVKKQEINTNLCAVKTIHAEAANLNCDDSFVRELYAFLNLGTENPFIPKLIGYHEKKPFIIITEWAGNMDTLCDILKGNYQYDLDSTDKTTIALGIIFALKHMHKYDIYHNDLHPRNILLEKVNYPNSQKKKWIKPYVIDFGRAHFQNERKCLIPKIGVPPYIAPEIMNGGEIDDRIDIYNLGIILYELYIGRQTEKQKRLNDKPIANLKEMEESSPDLTHLISGCWNFYYYFRFHINEVFSLVMNLHIYFPGADMDLVEEFIREYDIR